MKMRSLYLAVVMFFIFSSIPPPLQAGQPLSASVKNNQPTIALGKILAKATPEEIAALSGRIQDAIDLTEQDETYLKLKELSEKILDPNYVESEGQKAKQEAAPQVQEISQMATNLQQLVDEKAKRTDRLEKTLTKYGNLPEEFKFGEKDKGKTASQVLNDPNLKKLPSFIDQAEKEAKSLAASYTKTVPTQLKAWNDYLNKLRKMRADLNEKNFAATKTQFANLKLTASPLPQLASNSAARILLSVRQPLQFFLINYPQWGLTIEIVRVNIQRQLAKQELEQGANRIQRYMASFEETTGTAELDKRASFLSSISQTNLSAGMKKSIQDFFTSYDKIKKDFPKKRELVLKSWKEANLDPGQYILSELEPYRNQLIDRIRALQEGKPVGPFPPRPRVLSPENDTWFNLPAVTPTSTSMEPYDSLFRDTKDRSEMILAKIAFQRGVFPVEGTGNFFFEFKKSVHTSRPASWSKQPDFVVKDEETAKRILGNVYYDTGVDDDIPEKQYFRPRDVWIVTTGTTAENTISKMEVKNENGTLTLIVTITDGAKPTKPLGGLPYQIVKIRDPIIAAAIAGGAPVKFVHVPA